MAKGEKRISINALEKVAKEQFPAAVTEQWFGLDVTIQKTLSLTEMMAFVDDVVASCFHDQGGFMPEIKDFAIRSNVLTRYANFTLPNNLEKRYELLYCTNAVEFVGVRINGHQFDMMMDAIDRKIDYLCDTNIACIQKKLTELVGAFETMQKNTEEVFSGVTAEDMGKLMAALAEHGTMDEKKIVDALLEHKDGPTKESTESSAVVKKEAADE